MHIQLFRQRLGLVEIPGAHQNDPRVQRMSELHIGLSGVGGVLGRHDAFHHDQIQRAAVSVGLLHHLLVELDDVFHQLVGLVVAQQPLQACLGNRRGRALVQRPRDQRRRAVKARAVQLVLHERLQKAGFQADGVERLNQTKASRR